MRKTVGILNLQDANTGNTLKQGDKTTEIKYRLRDKDNDSLNVAGKDAIVKILGQDKLSVAYETNTVVGGDDVVGFTIDSILLIGNYIVEIIADGRVFPSHDNDDNMLQISQSSLGSEAIIIESIGKEDIVNSVIAEISGLEQFNVDLSGYSTIDHTHDEYITDEELVVAISNIPLPPEPDLTNYVTNEELTTAIDNIPLPPEPDLSSYATKDDLANIELLEGPQGDKGEDGKDAYELWLEQGNEGTIDEFINSLKGEQGVSGEDGTDGVDGTSVTAITLTQSEYDALTETNPNTFYVVI